MRVRFFSDTDLSCDRNLYKAEEIFENLDDYYIIKDINDAIELYNTKLYIDSGIYLSSWTEEQKEKYISIYSLHMYITSSNLYAFICT